MTSSSENHNLIDRSVKALFRECPDAFLRLAGMNVPAGSIRVEDPNVNLPELRADHVFLLSPDTFGQETEEISQMQDLGLMGDWLAEWEARGEAKGEAKGEVKRVRETLLRIGRKRLGEPDAATLQILENIESIEILNGLTDRILEAETWGELIAKEQD